MLRRFWVELALILPLQALQLSRGLPHEVSHDLHLTHREPMMERFNYYLGVLNK